MLRDGIATFKGARFDLGITSNKDGTSGSWFWTLPYNPNDPEIIDSKFEFLDQTNDLGAWALRW